MARWFDYSEWELDEVCNSIRERIRDSKHVLPPKVMRHYVSIMFRISESSYTNPSRIWFSYDQLPHFETRQDAEKYLDSMSWLEKTGVNSWVEEGETRYYDTKDGDSVPVHYEIHENDIEEFEDGEEHVEYSDEEKQKLSEILYLIEKAKVCLDVYDHCSDQWSFGHGQFSEELKERLERFETEFTEELPQDYDED